MIAGVKSASASPTGRRRALILLASALLALAFGGASASAATLTRGFADDVWFDSPADHISDQRWITKTAATGAKLVQIEVDWNTVEPRAPSHRDQPTDPAGKQFNFASIDQGVKEFAGTGLQPIFLVTNAPRWAEGMGGTGAEYATGGYEPNPTALGQLAQAMARRYSGSYPDPLRRGKKLPRVRYYQAWAEANMNLHLSPQWTRSKGKFINTGATIYRRMLNAFYAGVKAGDRDDLVIASGLESYGDPPDTGLKRTPPVTFLENVLCLDTNLSARPCPSPAHFDVLASDPYDAFAPDVHAVSPLDASAPDLGRLKRVVAKALQAHTLLPGGHKPLWVTEFGYESKPPNRQALPTATQARWLEESFYVFWREGVSTLFWYLVRDQAPPYSINYASGVYFRDGRPKPSETAYRFPLVVMPDGGNAQIWGIAPTTGIVRVQRRTGSVWQTIASFHRRTGTIFEQVMPALPRGHYRATINGQHSLVWTY
jgi:hypothetical protein